MQAFSKNIRLSNVIDILSEKPDEYITASYIADKLNIHVNNASKSLEKLVALKKVSTINKKGLFLYKLNSKEE